MCIVNILKYFTIWYHQNIFNDYYTKNNSVQNYSEPVTVISIKNLQSSLHNSINSNSDKNYFAYNNNVNPGLVIDDSVDNIKYI